LPAWRDLRVSHRSYLLIQVCALQTPSPETLTIAFQGEPGAYSEQAALEYFGMQAGAALRTLPCESFDDAFAAIEGGTADFGMLPIENSLAGTIHRNYDLMLRHSLYIVGEYHLRVRHCLLALPGVQLEEIKVVHSHPQALAQCESRLRELGVRRVAEADTAGSARLVRERGDRQAAALASARAAQVYQLAILRPDMEDDPSNTTRFLALARQPAEVADPETGDYKTTIVFSLHNRPGALFKALSVFALRDIDLTKLESRPMPPQGVGGQLWEYLFYIDFAGHAQAQACSRALAHLSELAPFLRLLGSYPRHRQSRSA